MAKITLATVTGNGAVTLNANFSAIVTAIENTLSRDGTTPNQMEADFDMNSNHIINLPAPTSNAHAATKEYVDDEIVNALENIVGPDGLASIAAIAQDDGQIIVGNGTKWVGESGATARASLGLTIGSDVQAYSSVLAATTASFTTTLESKLSGIEASATADQTGAEIKALYEAEADTNAFTDALLSKLNGIESGATGDQTGSEIKTLYEAQSDTNAFTDALLSKLNGIESGADVTDTTNVTAAGAAMLTGATFTGNVGIGVSPSSRLHVRDDTDTVADFIFQNTDQRLQIKTYWESGVGQYSIIQSTNDAESAGQVLSLNPSGGNVGIGTTSPQSKFHVQDSPQTPALATTVGHITVQESTGGNGMMIGMFYDGTNPTYGWLQAQFTGGVSQSYPIALNPLGGNVGVNTDSPSWPLTVEVLNTATEGIVLSNSTDSARSHMRPGEYGVQNSTLNFWDYDTQGIIFYQGSGLTEIARFNTGGNLGIGLSTPQAKLDVNGAIIGKAGHNGTVSGTLGEAAHGKGQILEIAATTTFSTMSAGAHGVLINDTASAKTIQRASGTITLYRNGVSVTSFQIPARGVGRFYYTSSNVVYYSGDVV